MVSFYVGGWGQHGTLCAKHVSLLRNGCFLASYHIDVRLNSMTFSGLIFWLHTKDRPDPTNKKCPTKCCGFAPIQQQVTKPSSIMSHSIGIPGFVNERKQDILALAGLQQPTVVGSKRDRISMYRTRSYLCYRMSRAVKERHKRGPALFKSASIKSKVVNRRQKRLPRILQSTFGGNVVVWSTLTPSNKQKRQKSNLIAVSCLDSQQELETKSVNMKLRLNTHLWHTKRFKFLFHDGWYIPTKHKSRGLKAVDGLYDKCVIQDVSYYAAYLDTEKVTLGPSRVVVTGSIADINSMFALYTDPLEPLITTTDEETDDLIVLEAFEKELVFYSKQKFPAACMGPVSLLVTPLNCSNISPRTAQVHVSCHPSIAQAVYKALRASCCPSDDLLQAPSCVVTLVPARLNRLRLRGPESTRALLSLLHAPTSAPVHAENVAKIAYLRAVLGVRDLSKHFEDGDVITLNLADPRRTSSVCMKPEKSEQSQRDLVSALKLRPNHLAADSVLFDNNAEFAFETEHEFNKTKHSAKVRKWESLFNTTSPFPTAEAASSNPDSTQSSCNIAVLPVLLIRKATPMRSFKTQKHRLSGWDIVLPAVWCPLVFRHLQQRGGAAAVGCEEMDHLLAKSGIPTFPRDFPDTPTGRAFWEAHQASECADNKKRPPLKQIVSHNFSAVLTSVAQSVLNAFAHSAADISDTLIVRGENYLKDFLPPAFGNLSAVEVKEAQESESWRSPHIARLPALPRLMFLQVLLIPTSRGLILDLAELVCPSQEDVAHFVCHKKHTQTKRTQTRATSQHSTEAPLTIKGLYEPMLNPHGTSATTVETEDLPKEWEGVQLSRARVAKNPLAVASSEAPTDASNVKNNEKKAKNVPRAGEVVYELGQDRKLIGTVTTGQKEHLNNTHFAVGLCNVNALNEMFQMSYGKYPHPQAHVLVLYRNARSNHLRPAVLQIV